MRKKAELPFPTWALGDWVSLALRRDDDYLAQVETILVGLRKQVPFLLRWVERERYRRGKGGKAKRMSG